MVELNICSIVLTFLANRGSSGFPSKIMQNEPELPTVDSGHLMWLSTVFSLVLIKSTSIKGLNFTSLEYREVKNT